MSVPVTLIDGQVIATQNAESLVGLGFSSNPDYMFGIIYQVNDSSGNYSVGQYIVFDTNDITVFTYSSATYYLLNISNIKLIETPAP